MFMYVCIGLVLIILFPAIQFRHILTVGLIGMAAFGMDRGLRKVPCRSTELETFTEANPQEMA